MRPRPSTRPVRVPGSLHPLAIAALAILIGACAGQTDVQPTVSDAPATSLRPSPRTMPSSAPSAVIASEEPSPTQAAAPTLAPDTVAQVVTTDLVQRSAPGTGADSAIYRDPLNAPTFLYVVEGPTLASGFEWYLVQPFVPELDDVADPAFPLGWVAAASKEGEAWIAPSTIACHEATFAALVNLSPLGRLACHGSSQITFEGTFDGFTAAVPGLVQPSWISTQGYTISRLDDPHPFGFAIVVHVYGEVGMPAQDQIGAAIEVEGHFDDPAARTCRPLSPPVPFGETPPPAGPLDDEALILTCRTNFVATSVEVIRP